MNKIVLTRKFIEEIEKKMEDYEPNILEIYFACNSNHDKIIEDFCDYLND
jgi:hypothetical protein